MAKSSWSKRSAGGALVATLGLLSFWSTAGVEMASGLLIAVGVIQTVRTVARPSPRVARQILRNNGAILLLLILYLAAVAASHLANAVPFTTHPGLLWHPLVFPALLIIHVSNESLRKTALLFLASAVTAAIAGLAQSIWTHPLHSFGTFIGATSLTSLLSLATLPAIAIATSTKRPTRSSWWIAAAGAVIVVALIRSTERAPVLVALVFGAMLLSALRPRLLPLWGTASVVLILFGSESLAAKLGWVLEGRSIDRYRVWLEGLKLLQQVPLFGHGPGSFDRILPQETWGTFMHRPPTSWHNDLLQTALESGPIAAAALGGIGLIGFSTAARAWRNSAGKEGSSMTGVIGTMLVALLTLSQVNCAVTSAILGIAFWTLLGLLITREEEALPGPAPEARRPG